MQYLPLYAILLNMQDKMQKFNYFKYAKKILTLLAHLIKFY